MKKYTDDDLLRFLWRQIKAIDIDAEESAQDEIVFATIIYKNGSETDCKLPRKLLDYLIGRLNGLFHKHDRQVINGKDSFLWFEEENINEIAKKVKVEATNSADGSVDKDIGCCPSEDTCEDACKDTDTRCVCIDDEGGIKHINPSWRACVEAPHYDLRGELIEKDHEIWKLRRTVEALEYLVYNCIPKDDRRKD